VVHKKKKTKNVIKTDSGGSKTKIGVNIKLYSQQTKNIMRSKIQDCNMYYVSSNGGTILPNSFMNLHARNSNRSVGNLSNHGNQNFETCLTLDDLWLVVRDAKSQPAYFKNKNGFLNPGQGHRIGPQYSFGVASKCQYSCIQHLGHFQW
jgi:hypothetical protein